jgi:hypothetical protein
MGGVTAAAGGPARRVRRCAPANPRVRDTGRATPAPRVVCAIRSMPHPIVGLGVPVLLANEAFVQVQRIKDP